MTRILGTAGHIDHGKTTLIKALTGVDTDRLKEERERGISIDLGFARFCDGDIEAGVVDVPGHERFIRNMLAGAHGIDVVLLVVAADDGVMPQTEEHLDIVHLLGVRAGVVALTKIDLVDHARRRAAREDIEVLLAGTALEGAPIVEVSALSGEGMDELRQTIGAVLGGHPARSPGGSFRLPVDRAFVMRGHGVVVTGTAIAGTVAIGAALRVLPGGAGARVRAVQVHDKAVERAGQGQRVALNLGGVEPGAIRRGQVVCDPDLERATDRFDAWVELRPAARRPLARHAAVRLHLGSAEAHARIVWLDGREALPPRQAALAQIVARAPIAAFGGDRFVLRTANGGATIGGGIVLQPFAPRPSARVDPRLPRLEALRDADSPLARLEALLDLDPAFAVTPAALAAAANLRADEVRARLAGHPSVRPLPGGGRADAFATAEKWQRLRAGVAAALSAFHAAEPRLPGMEMESLRSRLAVDLSPNVFRAVVEQLAREGVLARADSLLHLPTHRGGLRSADRRLAARALTRLAAAGFTPPDLTPLAAELGVPVPRLAAVLAELERDGRVARAAPELFFAAETVERAKQILRAYVAEYGEITAAQFRDCIDASRKFSIALLSHLDRTGFTLRVGDVRKVRR